MRAAVRAAALAAALLAAAPAMAAEDPPPPPPRDFTKPSALCGLIEVVAEKHGMPKAFFARLIWRESRFDINAVSPVGAQGVAQFMPYTAKERGLSDPFNPTRAIPASGAYLADLRAAFGSWGLAAAAYNGGPDRVARFLSGRGGLPGETLAYVQAITNRPAGWFREDGREVEPWPLMKDTEFRTACAALPVIATRAAPRPPWGAVVAGGRNYRAAQIAFNRARQQARGRIDPDKLYVLARGRRGGGPRYLALLAADSRREAQRLCLRVRQAGVPCTIRRN